MFWRQCWLFMVGSALFAVGTALGFAHISATLAVVAVTITVGMVEMKSRNRQAAWVNVAGSIAFGASAVGAFVTRTGVTADALLANVGTFFGALCFLTAALMVLPDRSRVGG